MAGDILITWQTRQTGKNVPNTKNSIASLALGFDDFPFAPTSIHWGTGLLSLSGKSTRLGF